MKKALIRITAGLCAVIMLSACPLAALAEDVEGPITGSQHVKGSVVLNQDGVAVAADVNQQITIDGSVSANQGYTAISAEDGSRVEVGGNVSLNHNSNTGYRGSDDSYGTGVDANQADVTVDGTVSVNFERTDKSELESVGIVALSSNVTTGAVTVNTCTSDSKIVGVIGVYAKDTGKTTVNGDVSVTVDAAKIDHVTGLDINSGAEAAIHGDVKVSATGKDKKIFVYGIDAHNNSGRVTVDGDVIVSTELAPDGAGVGISSKSDSSVEVGGNVYVCGGPDEDTFGISLIHGERSAASVTVAGDVIVKGGSQSFGAAIGLNVYEGNLTVEGTLSGDTAAIILVGDKKNDPVLLVGTLEEGSDGFVQVSVNPGSKPFDSTDIIKNVDTFMKNDVNYIINSKKIRSKNYKITGAREMKGYDTAREDETFVVSGVKNLKAGKYAKVVKLKNGVYAVTVNRGGNLILREKNASAFTAALVMWTGEGDAVTVFTCNNKKMMPEDIGSIVVTLDSEVLEAGQYTLTEEGGLLTVVLSTDLLSSLRTGNHRLALVVNGASYPSDLYIA